MPPIHLAVLSSNRSKNVPTVEEQCTGTFPVNWYVPEGQGQAYLDAGAVHVIECEGQPPAKPRHLNVAMEVAFKAGAYLVNIDDDLMYTKEVSYLSEQDREHKRIVSADVSLSYMALSIAKELEASPYYLAGPSPLTSAFWSGVDTKFYGAVQGKMGVHKPNDMRYDESLREYEDADYTIRHHLKYGGVVIVNRFLVKNRMWTNAGGYVDVRKPEVSQEVADWFKKKYSGYGVNSIGIDEKGRMQAKFPWKRLAEIGKSEGLFKVTVK